MKNKSKLAFEILQQEIQVIETSIQQGIPSIRRVSTALYGFYNEWSLRLLLFDIKKTVEPLHSKPHQPKQRIKSNNNLFKQLYVKNFHSKSFLITLSLFISLCTLNTPLQAQQTITLQQDLETTLKNNL